MSLRQLLVATKTAVPEQLRQSWYLIAVTALVACGKPDDVGSSFIHVKDIENINTHEQLQALSLRFRDLLFKEWTLVGIPAVVTAFSSLAKAQKRFPDLETKLSQKWAEAELDQNIYRRGNECMQTVYKQNLDPILSSFGTHAPDVDWLMKQVIYGLFLSDTSILSAVETELVTLTSIICQGSSLPSLWHLRGLQRLGVDQKSIDQVEGAIKLIAEWAGKDTVTWPTLADVREDK